MQFIRFSAMIYWDTLLSISPMYMNCDRHLWSLLFSNYVSNFSSKIHTSFFNEKDIQVNNDRLHKQVSIPRKRWRWRRHSFVAESVRWLLLKVLLWEKSTKKYTAANERERIAKWSCCCCCQLISNVCVCTVSVRMWGRPWINKWVLKFFHRIFSRVSFSV